MLGIDIALFIFQQDHDVLLVSYADNGSGVWTYGDVVENKYVFQTCTSSSLYPITYISNLQILLVIVYSSDLIKIARFTLNFVFIDKVEIKKNECLWQERNFWGFFIPEMTMNGFNFWIGTVLKTAI